MHDASQTGKKLDGLGGKDWEIEVGAEWCGMGVLQEIRRPAVEN